MVVRDNQNSHRTTKKSRAVVRRTTISFQLGQASYEIRKTIFGTLLTERAAKENFLRFIEKVAPKHEKSQLGSFSPITPKPQSLPAKSCLFLNHGIILVWLKSKEGGQPNFFPDNQILVTGCPTDNQPIFLIPSSALKAKIHQFHSLRSFQYPETLKKD